VDDGAALHFVDGELIRVVSSRYGMKAYELTKIRKTVTEKPLEAMYLGDESLANKEQENITKSVKTLTVINSFVHMINDHKIDFIIKHVTDDHIFYDSMGLDVSGLVNLKDAWGSLFSLFPDYTIEIKEIMVEGNEAVIFGEITGTFIVDDEVKGKKWKVPAAWKVRVKNEKIADWRAFTDMEPIREMRRRAKNGRTEMAIKIHGEKIEEKIEEKN
jgi:ketosteroid isomerase-like protein